jgi:cell division protein FtsI/penicillin-binding protein 2
MALNSRRVKKNNQYKLSPEIEIILAFITIILLLILFGSCNPVKQVLGDNKKFEVVATEVIKRGYCECDTLYKFKTDTLEVHDTTTVVYVDTAVINDTTYLWETKYHTITKLRTIRDSVKMVLVDSARIKVLTKELSDAKSMEKLALADMKKLQMIVYFIGGGALLFFLLLFKLK